MKVVNLKEFLALPDKTVYCKHSPKDGLSGDWFDVLHIKEQTSFGDGGTPIDWFYSEPQDLIGLNEWGRLVQSRDGLYEEDQLFLVYDKEDIERIINELRKCFE